MEKQEIIAKYATKEGDTGSPEVQIALLTERINHLNQHLKVHINDNDCIGHYRSGAWAAHVGLLGVLGVTPRRIVVN